MRRCLITISIALLTLPLAATVLLPERVVFRVVATGLDAPWEIAWGPDNYIWVTERLGHRVTRVNPVNGSKSVVLTISDVYEDSTQDGLLGMALHPKLMRGAGSDYVYVAYTYDRDSGPGVDRRGKIRRYRYDSARQTLVDPLDLITDLPAGTDHIGGRLIYGPDDKLYFTIGDQGANHSSNYCNPNHAQDLPSTADVHAQDWTLYQGKILRLNPDGSIPLDNPVLARVRSHIYSYGHRNPQGLAFGPRRKLYETEHGPDSDDELNFIEAGKNYGWPYVAGYRDDRGYVYANWSKSRPIPCTSLTFSTTDIPPSVPRQKESTWHHPDFRLPLKTFFTVPMNYDFQASGTATIAPSGMDVIWNRDGHASVFVVSLTQGVVYRIKLTSDGRSVAGMSKVFKSTNRYRDIAIHPDHKRIYLATDNDGVSTDSYGNRTQALTNPGSILEFTDSPAAP